MARYFLLSVSTRKNLDLCRRYALAGTTNSDSGVWAYTEVRVGDYVSFLYGAKAYDLYSVERKYAVRNADNLGPWPKIRFKESGNTYYFPFRLELTPVRRFEESLVRTEFAYVAENLLLRGGYRRTHFQADQTTLQAASALGEVATHKGDKFDHGGETFEPTFAKSKTDANQPETYHFREFILQSLLKDWLSSQGASRQLFQLAPALEGKPLEVLGEKALQKGLLDILVKEATPIGRSHMIVVEVKNRDASLGDLAQLAGYRAELGDECVALILAARKFTERLKSEARESGVKFLLCELEWSGSKSLTYEELTKASNFSFVD